jgi:hypothetical protein
MGFDPVVEWARVVAACNQRDWAVEACFSESHEQIVVVGDIYDSTPAYRQGRDGLLATIRQMAERRGWTQQLRSVTGVGDRTVVAVFEDCFDDGTTRPGCALVRFNAEGKVVRAYHPGVPVEDGVTGGRSAAPRPA